jgi:hypothetical protein
MSVSECPRCHGPLEAEPTAVMAKGPHDSIDDPALERWNTYRCETCAVPYRVSSKTGEVKEIRLGS